jgi:hypothetical protein
MAAMESRLQVMLQAVQTVRPPLDVNFQEVVHSVRTGNADVAKPQ